MSISLPNGTLLAAPSSTTQQYTAAVTRILHLANFSPELKTRDLQGMFREYENEKGGFRIKWLDDVNALVVFSDAGIAKRAYLSFLLHPPSHFLGLIRPYDRPDAAQIIQSLAARTMGHRGSSSNATTTLSSSISQPLNGTSDFAQPSHSRTLSTSSSFGAASKTRASISSNATRGIHHRTGSGASYSRQPLSGVLNFNVPATRLPTHSESEGISRSTSGSDNEPTITMEPPGLGSGAHGGANFGMWRMGTAGSVSGTTGSNAHGGVQRRDSLSAEKALKEVEKALASVEIQV